LYVSIINLGTVYYQIGRIKGRREADETLKGLYRLPITILQATDQIVLDAAPLRKANAKSKEGLPIVRTIPLGLPVLRWRRRARQAREYDPEGEPASFYEPFLDKSAHKDRNRGNHPIW
jgi:hypothetical protein